MMNLVNCVLHYFFMLLPPLCAGSITFLVVRLYIAREFVSLIVCESFFSENIAKFTTVIHLEANMN